MRSRGRAGATVIAPAGAAMPARASSQPAISVSASGTGSGIAAGDAENGEAVGQAGAGAALFLRHPGERSGRRPPSRATAVPSSSSSRARLIVCGSARSANIRAAVSATILSLSVTIAAPAFLLNGGRPHGAMVRSGRTVGKRRRLRADAAAPPAFVELIGATIPGSVTVINKQKTGCRPATAASAAHPGRIQWEQNLPRWRRLFSPVSRSAPPRRRSPSTAGY